MLMDQKKLDEAKRALKRSGGLKDLFDER